MVDVRFKEHQDLMEISEGRKTIKEQEERKQPREQDVKFPVLNPVSEPVSTTAWQSGSFKYSHCVNEPIFHSSRAATASWQSHRLRRGVRV